MPHLTARVPEAQLAGHESALITALTGAVVQVYGEWARDLGSSISTAYRKDAGALAEGLSMTPRLRSVSASARRP